MPPRRKKQDESVEKQLRTSDLFVELGRPGRKLFAGVSDEEWLAELRGIRGFKAYREMRDNSPIVGATLLAIEMILRRVPIRIEQGGQDTTARRARQLVEESFAALEQSWASVLSEILTFLVFGWAVLEIVYQRHGGHILWRAWSLRSQESLSRWIEQDGRIVAMEQQPPPTYETRVIPLEKALHFVTQGNRGNPEGRSVLRNAFKSYYYARRLEQIEAIGVERNLAGLPLARVPIRYLEAPAGTPEAAILDEIKRVVTRVRADEQGGVVWPLEYDEKGNELFRFELISSSASRQVDTSKIIERHEQRMAMSLLFDVILLGHERVGSFALASSKTDLFALALAGWLGGILETINKQAVPRLLELNGMGDATPPRFAHGDIESPDLKELGEYVERLSGAGFPLFPTEDGALERALLEAASLPSQHVGRDSES